MNSEHYYIFWWLFIAAWVGGIFFINGILNSIQQRILNDPELKDHFLRQISFLGRVRLLLWSTTILLTAGFAYIWLSDNRAKQNELNAQRQRLWPVYKKDKVWEAPDPLLASTDKEAAMIDYGRQLIAQTQDYYGANGIVRARSINAMNCQNCHLEAGTKPFGNNYFGVASTYPQMRARSGGLETIPKRVNDCFERSLNGQPIDTTSREMKAILAYMRWLGTAVPKGEKPKGSGIAEVPYLNRAADPAKGQEVYVTKCASCHGTDGQGLPIAGTPRDYPPLWGNGSYNQGAGLFRLSRLAGYVKANMPFGASYQNPQLSDEEAWDVAAFINSQPRPPHPFLKTDWPKIEKKPIDHPFGPYKDPYPETQHKYGPFPEIVAFYSSKEKKK